MDNLKACPFCNSTNSEVMDAGGMFTIQCVICEAQGPWRNNDKEAAQAWNRSKGLWVGMLRMFDGFSEIFEPPYTRQQMALLRDIIQERAKLEIGSKD